MAENDTNQGSPGWSPGGPDSGSMDRGAVDSEIRQIESSPDFAGDGKMDHWDRQAMLKRRDELYRHPSRRDPEREAADEAGNLDMYDTLKAQGVTKESVEADQEKYADRDWKEAIAKAEAELQLRLGGKEQADAHLKRARSVLNQYGKQEDIEFINETGIGNDPDFIQALAKVAEMLEAARRKKR